MKALVRHARVIARNSAAPAALALGTFGSMSFAAVGTDFSGVLTGLDASTIATAIVAAAAILALVGFAKWGSKKLGKFFG